jgi:hypothetical protein
MVWTLALLSALALPALSVALPRWQLDLVRISPLPASSFQLPAPEARGHQLPDSNCRGRE